MAGMGRGARWRLSLGLIVLVVVVLWLAMPSGKEAQTRSASRPAAVDDDRAAAGRDEPGSAANSSPPEVAASPSEAPATNPITSDLAAPPVDDSGELLLASSFDRPVCGRWYNPDPRCEFGVEGGVEDGSFDGRTGDRAVRIDRTSPNHMGVISDQPLPDGGAFVGVAHRVPALSPGIIKASPGHIQIMQLSPTDGKLRGRAVEVRLFPDRRLGLALHRGDDVAMVDWPVPVDEWFYVVVQVVNGTAATQKIWVYDSDDRLAGSTSIVLDTTQGGGRTAQKIGGSSPTTGPLFTYADDWYISTSFLGPARIGEDGVPILG